LGKKEEEVEYIM